MASASGKVIQVRDSKSKEEQEQLDRELLGHDRLIGRGHRDRGGEAMGLGQALPAELEDVRGRLGISLGQAEGLPRLLHPRLCLLELPQGGAGSHLGHRRDLS